MHLEDGGRRSARYVSIWQFKKGVGQEKWSKYDPYKKQAMVYHLGEHKCHDKLYVAKNCGPGTEQSPTSLHSIPAKEESHKECSTENFGG